MSEATDYEDILDMGWDEIPEVKPSLPDGSYRLRGQNATYQPPKSSDGNPVVLFVDRAMEAMDDVEGLEEDYDVSMNKVFTRFYIDGPEDWDRVRKHLQMRGVTHFHSKEEGGIKATLNQYKGTEAIAYLKTRVFTRNDGSIGQENVAASWQPLDD